MQTIGTARHVLSASTVTGDEVVNSHEEKLGHIKDIMIDMQSGRVAYAVLSFGGVMGVGDKLFAIPWNAMALDATNHRLILDAEKQRLEQAPGFDKDNWPDFTDQTWGASIHEYYGRRPYWQE